MKVRSPAMAGWALLGAAWTCAAAAAPRGDYFTVRDAALAHFSQFGTETPAENDLRDEQDALAHLQALLRDIIGPSRVEGFTGSGTITLDTLIPDLGFGQLDGLAWTSHNPDTRVVVTTDALFKNWLAANPGVPQTIAGALRSEKFYTAAVVEDVHWEWYASIPVRGPPGSTFAVAFLGVTWSDIGETVPDRLAVAVAESGRIDIFDAKVRTRIPQIPACHAIWTHYEARSSAALSKYRRSHLQDKAAFEESTRLEDAGALAVRNCFATRAPALSFFKSVTGEAQSLVDRVEHE